MQSLSAFVLINSELFLTLNVVWLSQKNIFWGIKKKSLDPKDS